MLESKNIGIFIISLAIIGIFAYILLLMLEPSPYAEMVATHANLDNNRETSHVLVMIKDKDGCGKVNVSRGEMLKYYESQECFMLETEIQKHRRPTDAELLSHGSAFISALSSKLKACMSPEKRRELVGRIESGKNMTAFLDEIDRSKDLPGKLKRVMRKMGCGS